MAAFPPAFPILVTLIVLVFVVLLRVDEDVAASWSSVSTIVSRKAGGSGDIRRHGDDYGSGANNIISSHRNGDSACWLTDVFGAVPTAFSHVTKRQCRRRAVSNQGNEASFRLVASRLASGLPINVVAFGGSVCTGMFVGKAKSFAGLMSDFLNGAFPISGTGTNNHTVTNLCHGATGTNQAWESSRAKEHAEAVRDAHLVLVDKGTNDVSDLELKGTWQQPGHERGSDSVKFWTEALIRELRAKAPDAALLWVETAWRDWRDNECGPRGCEAPFHVDSAHTHLEVLEYYDVTQISMLRLLGPLGRPERRSWLDEAYFVDGFHPTRDGHKMITSAIGLLLGDLVDRVEESGRDSLLDTSSHSLSNDANVSTIPPLSLNPRDLDFLALDPMVALDLSDSKIVHRYLVEPGAWSYATDSPRKPKTFMTNATGGDCAVLYLGKPERDVVAVGLNLLFSYEGFGVARVELLEEESVIPANRTGAGRRRNLRAQILQSDTSMRGSLLGQAASSRPAMSALPDTARPFWSTKINCTWASRTSQVSFEKIDLEPTVSSAQQRPGAMKFLRICLDPSSPSNAHKLKLFGVTLY